LYWLWQWCGQGNRRRQRPFKRLGSHIAFNVLPVRRGLAAHARVSRGEPLTRPWKGCSAPPVSNTAADEADVPLPGRPVRVPADDRCVRGDANLAHIWATFVSPQTARSLCVAPLEVVPDTFSGRADANGRSASLCVVSLEIPLKKQKFDQYPMVLQQFEIVAHLSLILSV
jgi:hypothetical protein